MYARINDSLEDLADALDRRLAPVDAELRRRYPGDPGTRQPVHTVYVPADRYRPGTVAEWGREARAMLDRHAGSAAELADAFDLPVPVAAEVHPLVRAKLEEEPVEDLRIDFEDGYGDPGDQAEDRAAVDAAEALAGSLRDRHGPPFSGIRCKSLEAATRRRALRTLDRFVRVLADAHGGLPEGFVVTLPKVTAVEQVEAMADVCETLERVYGLDGRLRFEIQVETPQTIVASDGAVALARMIHAARGRCTGLHYGTYDYSAACGISGDLQSLEHPAADHAKAVMQVAAAGTGVRLSDGSTNVLPVGDAAAVHAAWRLHARLVRRSLERGFYQGWDMHPAQLPSRFAATFAFYRRSLASTGERLRAFVRQEGSGFLDEPATAQALAGYLSRGLDCGAVTEPEVAGLAGLDAAALRGMAGRGVDGRCPAFSAERGRRPGAASAGTGQMPVDAFNSLPDDEAGALLRACCDAPTWVATLLEHRPYADAAALLGRADHAARQMPDADVEQALSAHPRIGERADGAGPEAGWSRREQAGVGHAPATLDALAAANHAYERRFGRVFLICASGLGGEEVLTALRDRLRNDDATEWEVVRGELRRIALLRLRTSVGP